MTEVELAERLTRKQRAAMLTIQDLAEAAEPTIDALVRMGLVAEIDLTEQIGGAAIEVRRIAGIAMVANVFTDEGERVSAILRRERMQ